MGMTMTQKILAAHAGLDERRGGTADRGEARPRARATTSPTPVAVNEFEKAGVDRVFDREKIALVLDHFTPNKDIKAAEQCVKCARVREALWHHPLLRRRNMGIEHALLPEQGLVGPGDCVDRRGQPHLHLRRARRVLHRRRLHRHGRRHDDRQVLVQGARGDSGRAEGQASRVRQRQGRHPAPHRHDRRGRRALQVAWSSPARASP